MEPQDIVFTTSSLLFLLCSSLLVPPRIHATKAIGLRNETDHLELLAFKDHIIYDHFGALSSWNDSVQFCKWEGVTCSRKHKQRVTTLDLSSHGLQGSLSPSIGNLTFLQRLLLDNNGFFGEIPHELGHLHQLKHLNLSANSFYGSIPANLTYCSKLRTLSLIGNQLIGKIPADIGSLRKLETLDLMNNSLTGGIPPSIGNMSSLRKLSLVLNHLDGSIPDDISHLTTLEYFRVSVNDLTGTIPSPLYNISSLYYFSVASNALHGRLPPDMGITLPNLQFLLLDLNQFYGPFPASLANASGLSYIDISSNNFSGRVPSELGRLAGLHRLNMEFNQLEVKDAKEWEFMDSLTNCSYLEVLTLYDNMLGGMLPSSIVNLSSQLQVLSFGINHISGTIPNGIGNLANLDLLSFDDNLLTGNIPESIGKLAKLEWLGLSHNRFTGKIPSSLGNLTRLSMLPLFDNNLEGSIPPSLGNLQKLISLELGNNHLTGTIPKEIVSLSSLSIVLNLSSNSLDGPLPLEVGSLKNLQALDISGNMLSGNIPSTLGDCEILEYLYLDNNLFQGKIPPYLSNIRGLQELDLSHNNLTGPIPAFLEDFKQLEKLNLSFNYLEGEVPINGVFKNATRVSVMGNNKLCGGIPELHLPVCKVIPSRKKRWLLLLEIVMPASVVVLCLILLFFFDILRRKRKSEKNAPTVPTLGDRFLRVSYNELIKATDGFSSTNLIGKGGYGSVYKGNLGPSQTVVAVKVFNLQNQGALKSFLAECEALRSIRHRNLIKILSSCSMVDFRGNDFKALVFEFIPNGSLEKWLHPELDGHYHSEGLSLLQRLNIAVDVADAMDYLHNYCQPSLVHCDLKPGNVLLDNEMNAHVGDFGLARFISKATESSLTSMSSLTWIGGSVGYIAPEYGAGGQVATSGDVYSYGILLLEMLTGKRPIDDMFKDGLNLQKFVEMSFPDRIMEISDPLMPLAEDEIKTRECLVAMARIGLSCSNQLARERMNMHDVATMMHAIKTSYLPQGRAP